jgi:hypothetical protein
MCSLPPPAFGERRHRRLARRRVAVPGRAIFVIIHGEPTGSPECLELLVLQGLRKHRATVCCVALFRSVSEP